MSAFGGRDHPFQKRFERSTLTEKEGEEEKEDEEEKKGAEEKEGEGGRAKRGTRVFRVEKGDLRKSRFSS